MTLLKSKDRTPKTGAVANVHASSVDVQAGGSPSLLRGIPVVGGTDDVHPGDTVLLSEHDGVIYAHSLAARGGSRTITYGSASGSGGGGMIPHSMDYHTDEGEWHRNLTGNDLHEPKSHTHDLIDMDGSFDGNKLHIDWQPTNSEPDTSIVYADSPNHLSAILAGLDNAVTGSSSDLDGVMGGPVVTTAPSDAFSDERVFSTSSSIEVTVNEEEGTVKAGVLLAGAWSGLELSGGLMVNRNAYFSWSGVHRYSNAVAFVGADDNIWFDPVRSALYVNSGEFPDHKPAYDAAVTIHPAYKYQGGLVVQRPWPIEDYAGKIFRILDEQSHDLIVLTGLGDLESGGDSAFNSGSTGWQIAHDGSAEFNSVTVRGEFRASVFVVGEQHVEGGTLMVLEGAPLASTITT